MSLVLIVSTQFVGWEGVKIRNCHTHTSLDAVHGVLKQSVSSGEAFVCVSQLLQACTLVQQLQGGSAELRLCSPLEPALLSGSLDRPASN